MLKTNVIASKIGMVYLDFAWQSFSFSRLYRRLLRPLGLAMT
jgi:hypothetical protein